MGKILISAVIIVLAGLALLFSMGLSVTNLKSNVDVGVGIVAKLGCTSRYVSGFTTEAIVEDLRSYSEAVSVFTLKFNDAAQTASASIFGFNEVQARFRQGLGCTLELGETEKLDRIRIEGSDRRTTLPRLPSESVQAVVDRLMVSDNQADLKTRALVVVRDGSVIADAYAAETSAETPHLGWSMGKSVTSLLIGHLVMLDKLESEQTDLFPQWTDERSEIRLGDLLQMTSGLAFDETYAPGSDATQMLFVSQDGSAVARDQALLYAPGTHFAYSSGTTALLSRLIVTKLGGPQNAYHYIYQDLLHPLGIHTLLLEPDPSGVFVGSSFAYGSALDWARLGLIYANGGQLDGVRIVEDDWIAASTTPNRSDNGQAYGFHVWLNKGGTEPRWPDLPEDTFSMQGNRGQRVVIIPSMDLVIVRLGWSALPYPTNDNFRTILSAL